LNFKLNQIDQNSEKFDAGVTEQNLPMRELLNRMDTTRKLQKSA